MNKIAWFVVLLMGAFSQSALADQMECRGADMTLRVTDMATLDDRGFVAVELWQAEYDNARYADLFVGTIQNKSVAKLSQQQSFSARSNWNAKRVFVSMRKGYVVFERENGQKIRNAVNCRMLYMSPVIPDGLGG